MEMDLFVTPEKQRNHPSSVSLGKTPVRRKLIVDDDDSEVVSEKKGQSRTSGGGLRQFSVMGQLIFSQVNSLCINWE